MAASLRALVSALEDDPYCGTRPPHWPGGPLRLGSIEEIIANRFDAVELNPQPLPPIARNASAGVTQSTAHSVTSGRSGLAVMIAGFDVRPATTPSRTGWCRRRGPRRPRWRRGSSASRARWAPR